MAAAAAAAVVVARPGPWDISWGRDQGISQTGRTSEAELLKKK